ncbi:hypothetical protein [Compostibacter hankyongensis]|uniref:6-phosphogluconate dehydrogenase n=1 Tax=Compostibacter hankyongensis TaxID=1007089 RepID=A0ABP8FI75_9BACT
MKRFLVFLLFVLLIAGSLFTYWRYYAPFAEGHKSGVLKDITLSSSLYKTWKGRLSGRDFTFAVTDPELADSLQHCTGRAVVLHYYEYHGSLPWRGSCRYIADKVLFVGRP